MNVNKWLNEQITNGLLNVNYVLTNILTLLQHSKETLPKQTRQIIKSESIQYLGDITLMIIMWY